MLERWVYRADLRVRLGPDQARVTIACLAADAPAGMPVAFVEHHSQRGMKRMQAQPRKIVSQMLDPWLVADRGMGVGSSRGGLGRVLSALAVDVVQTFRFAVVRLQLLVADRPGWR